MKSKTIILYTAIIVAISLNIISCSRTPANSVGTVNGRPITYQQYSAALRREFESYMLTTGQTPDERAYQEIANKAWTNLVDGVVFQEQMQKYNISVSYEEVIEHLKENVPQIIQESRHFQTDGRFDQERYHRSLTDNSPVDLAWLVRRFYEVELPRKKLEERLFTLIDIPEQEIRRHFNALNSSAEASVIHFDLQSFANVNVSDPEIRSFYEKNRVDYILEPFASLNYMIIRIKPSRADSLRTKTVIDSVYTELQNGIDFRLLADVVSDGPTAGSGGDLQFVEFTDLDRSVRRQLEGLTDGSYTQPIRTKDGWVIYQINTRTRNLIRLREIFVEHKVSEDTRTKEYERILNIRNLAGEIGLEIAANEVDKEVFTVHELGPGNTVIPKLGKSDSIVERAVNSPPNRIFEPLYRRDLQAYVLIEVIDSQARGFKPLSRVSDEIRATLLDKKKRVAAYNEAEKFHKNHNFRNIIAQAKLQGYNVYEFSFFTVGSDLPAEPDIEPLAYKMLSPAKNRYVSEPVELEQGSYIGVVTEFNSPDMSQYDSRKPAIRSMLREREKETFFEEWMQEQISSARVRDRRHRMNSH